MQTYPLYLNGQFVPSEPAWDVTNPADGEVFARISTVNRARVAQAIADAHAAFAGWRQLTAKARGEFLRRIASELEGRREEVARLISRENGKPLAQSLAEVAISVDHLQWFAEEGRRAYGRIIPPQAEGKRNLVLKTPIGVVGAISPWNFPLMLSVRKLAPALAAGCPVVLKPARQAPLSCIAFAECAHAAGLPKGVLQVVCGPSGEIGEEFLGNPLCRREEIFAPMAPVVAFDTEAEAIQMANDTVHGLSAYAFTRDIGRMFRLGENLEAGMIGLNDGLPTTSNAPFGGVKQSGWGRELASEGLEAFLETKHLSVRF